MGWFLKADKFIWLYSRIYLMWNSWDCRGDRLLSIPLSHQHLFRPNFLMVIFNLFIPAVLTENIWKVWDSHKTQLYCSQIGLRFLYWVIGSTEKEKKKRRQWLTDIALEAETALNSLPTAYRPYYRKQVSTCITQLHLQNNNKFSHKTHTEWSTMNTIKAKLRINNAIVSSADKGKTLIILPTTQYQENLRDFTDNNNFQISNTDPTITFQKHTRKVINNKTNVINPDSRWKYTNLNPSAPTIRGLVKIHKRDQPIRPIVNWRNAPAYKLAKLFTHKIQQLVPLPFTFNVKNTRHLIQELKQTPLTPTSRFASLDISNIYSNVPTKESRIILEDLLSHNTVDPQTIKEVLQWYDTITQQNYFTNNGNIILQKDGLAIGAPSSGIISEILCNPWNTPNSHS